MDTMISAMEFASMVKKEKAEVCAVFVSFDSKQDGQEEWTHSDSVIREIVQSSN